MSFLTSCAGSVFLSKRKHWVKKPRNFMIKRFLFNCNPWEKTYSRNLEVRISYDKKTYTLKRKRSRRSIFIRVLHQMQICHQTLLVSQFNTQNLKHYRFFCQTKGILFHSLGIIILHIIFVFTFCVRREKVDVLVCVPSGCQYNVVTTLF